MRCFHTIAGLIILPLLLLAGCGPVNRPMAEAGMLDQARRADIYAAADGIEVGQGGKLSALDAEGQIVPGVPVSNGGKLSYGELRALRTTVYYTEAPKTIPNRCVPRHAFLFYDGAGKYLGYLKLDLAAGCGDIDPSRPPYPTMNWIEWDHAAVRQIAAAHHLWTLPGK